MCFALPFKIDTIYGKYAVDRNNKRVKLDLVGKCSAGDFVLTQADMAIEKISEKRAKDLYRALKKM